MDSFVSTIGEFLKMNTNKKANFDPNKVNFVIPKYQREYSWIKERVQTLIGDIKNRDKFLGNVIINKVHDYYELVDGQQRITTIVLILIALFNRSKGENDTLTEEQKTLLNYIVRNGNPVLKNESIGDYLLIQKNKLSINIKQDKDIYFQKETFYNLYENIENELSKLDDEEILSFQKKVLDCQILVLIGEPDGKLQDSIEEVFLDINYKSQVLDVADIFKGYCFKNYDSNSHEDLKDQWADIRCCTKQFEHLFGYNKNPRENTCEYLYLYLLSVPNSYKIPANLSIANKHYLEGKGHGKTKSLLEDMIAYGKNIISYDTNIKSIDYIFEDICFDANDHKNDISKLHTLRCMSSQIIEYKDAQYFKLPFFMLLHYLLKDDNISNALNFSTLKSIITNFYVYAFLFINSGKTKNKTLIAHGVLDQIFVADNADTTLKGVLTELRSIRKNSLDEFGLFRSFTEKSKDKAYSFYSIMDHYLPNENFIQLIYSYSNGYTLEHLLIHDNNSMEVTWLEEKQKFSLNLKDLLGQPDGKNYKATQYKKQTANYIILPKDLNEAIGHEDIVNKIDLIRKHYKNDKTDSIELPSHIKVFIEHIEAMDTYKKLALHKGKMESQDTITKDYVAFISEYFSEEKQASLYQKLETRFKTAFHNH